MANALKGKIWTLDTAAAVTTDPCYVKKIRWDADTVTAGDDVSITDPVTTGVLWDTTAPVTNNHNEEALVEEWWPNGFTLTALGGTGTKVYVHLG